MKFLGYEPHPIANAFRLLEGAEFDAFVADVKANGLLDKELHLYEGKLLDGRNRARACELLGIKPKFVEYKGDDPTAFVISRNRWRRHDNESQRAMAACRLAQLKQGQRKRGKSASQLTQAEAAAALNVGERTVKAARAVQERGVPELVAAVDAGDVAVSRAAELAELPAAEQRQELEAERTREQRRARPRPRNDEQPVDPLSPAAAGLQLIRVMRRALEQLGATVQGQSETGLKLAYAGRLFVVGLQDYTEGMKVA